MSNSSTRFHLPFGHMMESVRLLIDIPWSSSCLAHAEKKNRRLDMIFSKQSLMLPGIYSLDPSKTNV